jgi:flagellar basal body-associated protein FliL
MKIAILLGVVAAAANFFLVWVSKKCSQAKTGESSNPEISYAFSKEYLNTPEVKQLKKSTAAELGLSIEELDRRLAKEIKQLATEQESINIDGI